MSKEDDKKHPPYVTVYCPIAGWKAVMKTWDPECGAYTPWQTGYFAYKTSAEAELDAKTWAAAEEIEYKEIV